MTVDKYLKGLALNNRRVIIPDLGAFLSKEGDENGNNLIFSSFLKYNDGFLESYIAEKENITPTESLVLIQRFVEEVNKAIKAKRKYEVEGFGHFYMDERGGVAFSTEESKSQPVAPPVQESKPVEPVKPVVVTTPVTAKEPVTQAETKQTPTAGQTTAATTSSHTSYSSRNVEVKKETVIEKKNNNGLLLTIVILLLLIVLLLCSYFICDGVRKKVDSFFGYNPCPPTLVTPPVQPAVQPVDTVAKTPTETTAAPTVSSTTAGTYYVIVGTFMIKSNADKMYQQCVTDGYKPEMLPMMGEFYPVAVTKTTDKNEAVKIMWQMKDKYGDAWVYKARR